MITKEEYETYSNLRYKIHNRIDKVVNLIAKVQELNKKYGCGECLWSNEGYDYWHIVTKYGREMVVDLEACFYNISREVGTNYYKKVSHKFEFSPEYLFLSDSEVVLREKIAHNKRQTEEKEYELKKLNGDKEDLIKQELEQLQKLKEKYPNG